MRKLKSLWYGFALAYAFRVFAVESTNVTSPRLAPLAKDPCAGGRIFQQIAGIELRHRIAALEESIEHVRDNRSKNPALADHHLRRMERELDILKHEGVLPSENQLLDTDSYKASQYKQYPPNLTRIFSYFESRGGLYDKTLFFGLQHLLKKYFSKPITPEMVEQAKKFYERHGEPFNYEGWMHIAKNLGGVLPLKIRAVPEGSVIPGKNILFSIENTDKDSAWVVGWFETQFMRLWYPTTVGTVSYHIRETLQEYLDLTADAPSAEIDFKLHDFGGRGVSSQESAGLGGAAHLLNFKGTDTVAALVAAKDYYNEPMAGHSLPASEHSTMTSWGGISGEPRAMENMIEQFGKPGGIFACVSDSYNLWNAIENIWGGSLKQKLIDSGATLVVRPDSGDPATTVLKSLELLERKFGVTVNGKGYKVLNNVRVIQGDGINHESIKEILELVTKAGYSTTNVAFGMGGALLQQVNRDTLQFAFKASWGEVDGKGIEIFKDPITAAGAKTSKKGRLDLVKRNGQYQTIQGTDHEDSLMRVVFENGAILIDENFETVRRRTAAAREEFAKPKVDGEKVLPAPSLKSLARQRKGPWNSTIEGIHQGPYQYVVATTGGASTTTSELLAVPGGSGSILESVVPYSTASLTEWLGKRPDSFCSEETALAMAAVGHERARKLGSKNPEETPRLPAGVGVTAALASSRPKKGEHRFHLATQTDKGTVTATLVLNKGARTRAEEEKLISEITLKFIAENSGVDSASIPKIGLLAGEEIKITRVDADPMVAKLHSGEQGTVWQMPNGSLSEKLPEGNISSYAVLCGSFNPLHDGHRKLLAAAERKTGRKGAYELSIGNVNKPPLDYISIARRRSQFKDKPLVMTKAPTFAEKSRVMPGATFIIGADIATRIFDPAVYGGSEAKMKEAINEIRKNGCRFLVAGRAQASGEYKAAETIKYPEEYADLFESLGEADFREDISSTQIRRGNR